jgi:hypothetical protein
MRGSCGTGLFRDQDGDRNASRNLRSKRYAPARICRGSHTPGQIAFSMSCNTETTLSVAACCGALLWPSTAKVRQMSA